MNNGVKGVIAVKLTRKRCFLLIVAVGMSVLLFTMLVSLLSIDTANVNRYRNENYDRLAQNINAFDAIVRETDSLLGSLSDSLYAIPYVKRAKRTDLEAYLNDKQQPVAQEGSPFMLDTLPHKAYSRLSGLAIGSSSFETVALYAAGSGCFIVSAGEGGTGALCATLEAFEELTGIRGDGLLEAGDCALYAAAPTVYAASVLYIVRRLEDDLLLFCGISRARLLETLLADSSGRSYNLEQIALLLPDGGCVCRDEEAGLSLPLGIADSVDPIRVLGDGRTVMRYEMESTGGELLVVLAESGVTNTASSDMFKLLLLVNALWLIVVVSACGYILFRVFMPLSSLNSALDTSAASAKARHGMDDLDQISQTLRLYNQQLTQNRTTIDEQGARLRKVYLEQMVLNVCTATPAELDALGIHTLLENFMLVVIYPQDGRWTAEDGSEQQNRFHRYVAVTAVSQMLKSIIQTAYVEFVMVEGCLLGIVALKGETTENAVRQIATLWGMNMSAQLKRRFQFSTSSAYQGVESLSAAYREALCRAALLEEQESGRSEDVRMNAMLKQIMQMADLIYMERYDSAWECLSQTIESIFRQKSRSLRARQLECACSLALCMLLETNEANSLLLEAQDLDTRALMQGEDRDRVLQSWKQVFDKLEARRSSKLRGQYSEQFTSIYQYMRAHFREPGLSLSLIAEEFHMSVSTLSREFQKNLGQGFLESLHQMRIDVAKYEIEHTNRSLSDIAVAVGYTNTLTMTRAFKKYLGATPGMFRKKDEGSTG